MWTHFMDMHSGGGCKHKFEHIFIEAPRAEATLIFYNRFGTNPNRVSCTCCGEDYSISENADLTQLTAYERGCAYEGNQYVERADTRYSKTYCTLEDYLARSGNEDLPGRDHVLFIFDKDIKPNERTGSVPEQGYVWKD